jgi:glycosyltransferase involved in cell wall biosynthesis
MNKSKYSVSVIIPVYNTENYLPRALDSLIRQTLGDLEIVVVNDGSLGNCKQIVEDYQKKLCINYVNLPENKGRMIARIEGMKEAQGEYIGFVDADDFVEPGMYEKMYHAAKQNNADIVHCLANQVSAGNKIHKWKEGAPQHQALEGQDIFGKFLDHEIVWSLWDKLFRREIVNVAVPEMLYDRVQLNEDTIIFCVIAYYSKKYIGINEILYNYFINETGEMKTVGYHRASDLLEMASFVIDFCNKKGIVTRNRKLIKAICQWPLFLITGAPLVGKFSVLGEYLKYFRRIGFGNSLISVFGYLKSCFVKFIHSLRSAIYMRISRQK